MANYTQQCRTCHVNIEGTGANICYRCLEREHAKVSNDRNLLLAAALRVKECWSPAVCDDCFEGLREAIGERG